LKCTPHQGGDHIGGGDPARRKEKKQKKTSEIRRMSAREGGKEKGEKNFKPNNGGRGAQSKGCVKEKRPLQDRQK